MKKNDRRTYENLQKFVSLSEKLLTNRPHQGGIVKNNKNYYNKPEKTN